MIHLHEYKQYKKMAERYFEDEISQNVDIQIEIYKVKLDKISKEQFIENVINIFSDGEHFKK